MNSPTHYTCPHRGSKLSVTGFNVYILVGLGQALDNHQMCTAAATSLYLIRHWEQLRIDVSKSLLVLSLVFFTLIILLF